MIDIAGNAPRPAKGASRRSPGMLSTTKSHRLSGVRSGDDLSSFRNSCSARCQSSSSLPSGFPTCSQSSCARTRICSSVGFSIFLSNWVNARSQSERNTRGRASHIDDSGLTKLITIFARCSGRDCSECRSMCPWMWNNLILLATRSRQFELVGPKTLIIGPRVSDGSRNRRPAGCRG
jgi:hypothetical protein